LQFDDLVRFLGQLAVEIREDILLVGELLCELALEQLLVAIRCLLALLVVVDAALEHRQLHLQKLAVDG
jgi:hypothetical protein